MALSLATKYRPKKLDKVYGQESVVKILSQQLATGNIKNCYLFCGASGCGKTTTARILAKEINKGQGYPIEIDAASNSSVENVRNIIDGSNVKSIISEYKIYIIDECHSLSQTAWQALLKTLEEPNSKTIFIFCTTDVQKVPQTILNRVQRFDFHKISREKILERLIYICTEERFTYEEDALKFIVKASKGRMRDAISYLEKVASFNTHITLNECIDILGEIDYQIMFNLMNAIFDRKEGEALSIIESLNSKGKDLKLFIDEFTNFVLDINKYLVLLDFDNIDIPKVYEKDLIYVTNISQSKEFYSYILQQLVKLKEQIRFESDIKLNLEIAILFLCK